MIGAAGVFRCSLGGSACMAILRRRPAFRRARDRRAFTIRHERACPTYPRDPWRAYIARVPRVQGHLLELGACGEGPRQTAGAFQHQPAAEPMTAPVIKAAQWKRVASGSAIVCKEGPPSLREWGGRGRFLDYQLLEASPPHPLHAQQPHAERWGGRTCLWRACRVRRS